MRHATRHEGASAGPTNHDLVAYLKGDLTAEHPGDLIAVAVQVECRLGAGWCGLLDSIMLSAVSVPTSLSAAERPGAIPSDLHPTAALLVNQSSLVVLKP